MGLWLPVHSVVLLLLLFFFSTGKKKVNLAMLSVSLGYFYDS